ncbi:MAG: M23 family metallopeptidase [Niabella sp.]
MKPAFILLIFVTLAAGCSYLHNPMRRETRRLVTGKVVDTVSYVYDLPYPKGKRYLKIQGYFSHFTHKRRAAIDFKMPIGSTVCAAREGTVVRLKSDSHNGGIAKGKRQLANFIVIQHADGSRAGYWHLMHDGILVAIGDSVQKGQPIARSGNTGYTYLPHLHFIVWGQNREGGFTQIPTRFHTSKGARYLRGFRRFKNP